MRREEQSVECYDLAPESYMEGGQGSRTWAVQPQEAVAWLAARSHGFVTPYFMRQVCDIHSTFYSGGIEVLNYQRLSGFA